MKIRFYILLLMVTALAGCSDGEPEYYFYSPRDMRSVKKSAGTDWGTAIIARMEEAVAERLRHPLEIPVQGGGHIHNYHCHIHNTRLVFDWDTPKSHYCVPCGEHWEGNEKYDLAWIHILHDRNFEYLEACTFLYMAEGEKKYARRIADMLLDLADKYPDMEVHDREGRSVELYGGKMYSQSLDEAVWANVAARAFSVAAPVMSPEERTRIREGFFRPSASLMMRQRATNNWQVWHNAAIAAIGVVLEDDRMIGSALDRPDFGYHDMVKQNVYHDGWWNEGSVGYHFYPLRAMQLTAEAVRCRGIDLYDGPLHMMFSAPVNLLYPDLSFPSQNDVSYGMKLTEHAPLYELAALRTGDRQFEKLLGLCYREIGRSSANALINGKEINTNAEPLSLGSYLFSEMGVALLRGNGRTAVLKYGPHGGVHGHPDKLTVTIHDGQSEILPDLGTTAYGVPDCVKWYQNTFAHNTVTVDGKNQLPTEGTLVRFDPSPAGGIVEAYTDGAYPGVAMKRTLAMEGDTIEDIFICTSDEQHVYDYVLLLTEKVIPEGETTQTGYERIWDASVRKLKEGFSFDYKSAEVNISCPGNFEVITGTAPGLPPSGTAAGTECYPLIVRAKGKNMHITTTWKFKKQ